MSCMYKLRSTFCDVFFFSASWIANKTQISFIIGVARINSLFMASVSIDLDDSMYAHFDNLLTDKNCR